MARYPLALIAAVAQNGIIGRGGALPWDAPEDRAYFRRTTLGHAVIMGRGTWDERGQPLDGRRNLVVSRDRTFRPEGAEVFDRVEGAVEAALATDSQPFVIGGAEIYRLLLPRIGTMYLTEIQQDAEGDTRFPEWDPSEWLERSREERAGLIFRVLARRD